MDFLKEYCANKLNTVRYKISGEEKKKSICFGFRDILNHCDNTPYTMGGMERLRLASQNKYTKSLHIVYLDEFLGYSATWKTFFHPAFYIFHLSSNYHL